jgi:hypothetical protein
MDNKDLNLKFMCKVLYNKMGYSAHYEIKLRNKSYINSYKTHDVSDIDVFGYFYNADLTSTRIGSECKSGESSALEEFYKFFGVSKFYKLDRTYLFKTKLHQNARQIALDNGCITMTEAELRKLLIGFQLDVDKTVKIESGKYFRQRKIFENYKQKNEKLIEYLSLDYWNKERWKNIHNLTHILKAFDIQPTLFADVSTEDKYIYYYIAELYTNSLLGIISDAMTLNYGDFDKAFTNLLYGGAEAFNEKRKIQDAVNIATQQVLNLEPEWQADLVAICSRICQHTYPASLIPRLFQDIYENSFYSDKIRVDPKLVGRYPDLTRKFAQDIISFLTRNCHLNPAIFSDFMIF